MAALLLEQSHTTPSESYSQVNKICEWLWWSDDKIYRRTTLTLQFQWGSGVSFGKGADTPVFLQEKTGKLRSPRWYSILLPFWGEYCQIFCSSRSTSVLLPATSDYITNCLCKAHWLTNMKKIFLLMLPFPQLSEWPAGCQSFETKFHKCASLREILHWSVRVVFLVN